jgi:phage terminase small subunit
MVEDYIRALRMAELHRLYAQDRPYIESDRGTMKPHPGFELAKEADVEARRLAVGLGLEPAPTNEVTHHAPAPQRRESRERRESAADYFNTRLQEEAEDVGEVEHPTGPDGEPL